MKELPASQAYRVLEPGPIVMVSTSDNGKPNVMTMGFHTMIQHDPPLIGCVIGPGITAIRLSGKPENVSSLCLVLISPRPLSTSGTARAIGWINSKGTA